MLAGAVLIVDADSDSVAPLTALLSSKGMQAHAVESVSAAVAALDTEDFHVVLLDARAAGERAALPEVVKRFGEIPVVVIAAAGAGSAVEAVCSGAADFAEKPVDESEIVYILGKVLAARATPLHPPAANLPESGPLGSSKAMAHVLDLVRRVAASTTTVLVRGESGTGKELIARALHQQSARATRPFTKVHCAGLPETLLESELFGYEKGAFTGAASRKPGRVEIAEGGTLFLDEIGDITPAMQVKLLRLLQDREYERLGGTVSLRADVRFVAATHRDLEDMIKKGEFREDLFYRLNVVPIWLPPLRARREDIVLLAQHFCRAFALAHDKQDTRLSTEAIAVLSAERWPGNIRQLQNFIERVVVLSEEKLVDAEAVRRELSPQRAFSTEGAPATQVSQPGTGPASKVEPLDEVVRNAERSAIERALRHALGNRTLAARLLGVSRATIYEKIKEYGLGESS